MIKLNPPFYLALTKENNYYSLEIIGDEQTDILDSESDNKTIKSVLDKVSTKYKIRRNDIQALLIAGNRLIKENKKHGS